MCTVKSSHKLGGRYFGPCKEVGPSRRFCSVPFNLAVVYIESGCFSELVVRFQHAGYGS